MNNYFPGFFFIRPMSGKEDERQNGEEVWYLIFNLAKVQFSQ